VISNTKQTAILFLSYLLKLANILKRMNIVILLSVKSRLISTTSDETEISEELVDNIACLIPFHEDGSLGVLNKLWLSFFQESSAFMSFCFLDFFRFQV
jgi:hypothetical protein